jgi:hypothetical protein
MIWRKTIPVAALWLLCLAAVSPGWAQSSEEDPEDTFSEEEADEGEEEVEPAKADEERSARSGTGGIHPVYTISYDRNRDQGTWNHGFNFNYNYTPRISLSSNASVRRKSSLTAERVSRTQSTSHGIDFRVSDGLTMGFGVSRNWSEDETGGGASTKERIQEGLEINANYNTMFLGVLDTKITAGAGTEDREYTDVVSTGRTERIGADFSFELVDNLKTNFSYDGNLRISDSRQGDIETRDRNIDENVRASVNYSFWDDQKITFNASGRQTQAQYPSGGAQETRTMDDRSVGINADLKLMDGFNLGIKFNANDATTFYDLEPDRDNRKTGHGLQITIPKRDIALGFKGNLAIHDDQKRNEFKTPQTGTTTKHAVLGGVERDLGPNSSMNLKGRMELIRYEFDDKERNTRDRDLLNQALQLDLSYNPKIMTAKLSAEYKRAEQINIMPESAADNNTRHTYSVRPNFSFKLWRSVKVSQNYILSADYTLYHNDEERNLLVRTASLGTRIRYPLIPGLRLDVDHDYQLQDQGGYRKDASGINRYSRASESLRQRLTIRTGLEIGKFTFSISEAYEIKKQWTFQQGEKNLKYDASSIDISAQVEASFNLGSKTNGNVSLQQTQRDGKRLSENEKKYWNINARVTHNF